MMRDLEINKEEEDVDPSEAFLGLKPPYKATLRGDWDAMKSFFNYYPEHVVSPLTINEDTAFHIAAYSESKDLLQHLVDLLPPSRIFYALSKKNNHGNNTFHEVAKTKQVETAKFLIAKLMASNGEDGVRGSSKVKQLLEDRNKLGETPIYTAVALGQTTMAKFFNTKVEDIIHHFQRNDGISILHIAVIGQHFETAIWLLGKEKQLAKQKEQNDLTSLHLLAKMPDAFRSSSRMDRLTTFLYYCLPSQLEDDENDDGDEAQTSSSQLKDLERGQGSNSLRKSNEHFSRTTSNIYRAMWRRLAKATSNIYRAMWRRLAKGWPSIKRLWEMKMNHISALTLIELLVKADSTWASSFKVEEKTISLAKADDLDDNDGVVQFKQGNEKLSNTIEGGDSPTEGKPCDFEKLYKTPNTPLLIAASHGIEEIFDKIIDLHPQAIEHINKDEGNILHFAIAHRQRSIFRRVKQMKVVMQCRLVSRIDMNGYTLLHQAADMKYYKPTKPGPALQLQEELKWLERVRKIIPTHYVMHRNKNGLTADELFKEEHAQLLAKAQTWIKETSQSCSAVAVLVATVVFAAAYTVPGGNDANGLPNFLRSPFFSFFTVMDSISLASSLTSVVMFLSILSSPFEQEYFLKSLPRKLIIGFSLLFFSVTTTILSFVATIILILHFEKRTWTNTLIYTAAFLPVCMFALMQFPLVAAFTSCLNLLIKKVVKKVLPRPKIRSSFLTNP